MAGSSATVAQKRLARALRRLRAGAGLTIDQVSEQVDLSASTVSRLETAQATVRRGDIRELLDIYEVAGVRREELLQLAVESRQRPWWEEYSDLPNAEAAGLEAEAAIIRQYSALLVPGILQTEAYAREVLRAIRRDDQADDLERRLKLRRDRQSLLTKEGSPQYIVVLDEAVLRREVGGKQVMHAQVERLIEAVALPSVTLHLLPFTVGAHAAMDGAFTIFSYDTSEDHSEDHEEIYDDPDVLLLESREGDAYIENRRTTKQYNKAFEYLLDAALDPAKSLRALADAERQLQVTPERR